MPAIIVDPALQAAVIRQFNLRGELAPFNLTENVVPVFDIGSLVGNLPTVVTTLAGSQGVRIGVDTTLKNSIPVTEPRVAATDGGFVVNPGAAAVLVDTGQLTAANRTFKAWMNGNAIYDLIVEHRNAANAANIESWSLLVGGVGVGNMVVWDATFTVAANERVRIVTGGAVVGTVSACIQEGSHITSAAL